MTDKARSGSGLFLGLSWPGWMISRLLLPVPLVSWNVLSQRGGKAVAARKEGSYRCCGMRGGQKGEV